MPAKNTIKDIHIYLIIGKNDRLIPFYKVKNLQKIFKNSEYKCFDSMGHNLMLDKNWEEVYYYIIKNM
jgi:predicted esterase